MTPQLTWNPMSSVNFSKNTEKNLEKACKINEESDCITLLDHQKIVKTYINPKTNASNIIGTLIRNTICQS